MTSIIVADTGPLIALAKIGLLGKFCDAFEQVFITPAVEQEAVFDLGKPGATVILQAIKSGSIRVVAVDPSESLSNFLSVLDPGEAESIELAKKLNAILLIDEAIGRKAARHAGVSITGSGAILIKLKQQGTISEIRPCLIAMREAGYRLSQAIEDKLLAIAGE